MNRKRRLEPFFTFFGGKWRAAPHYPEPQHDVIVEPFCGSAGYSLNHYEKKVILRDVDPIIVGLWQYLLRVSESEVRGIKVGVRSVNDLGPVPQEVKWLVGFWLNKGMSSPRLSASSRFDLRPKSHWGVEIRERIAQQLQYVRHWKVSQGSYEDCANRVATWFIDPPYCVAGSGYRFSEIDYATLARWSTSRFGQQIVCESMEATWLPFAPVAKVKRNNYPQGRGSVGLYEEVAYLGHRELS